MAMRKVKQDPQQQVIKYIDNMEHCCLDNLSMHKIGACNNREQARAKLMEKYESGQWSPSLLNIPMRDTEKKEENEEL